MFFVPLAPLALGQAVPAARGPAFYTGFHLPDVSGTLRYSLSASERLRLGASNAASNGDTFNISGNVAYLSASPTHPFSMVYSGAYLYEESGNTPSQVVQRLSLSQILEYERWKFVIADSVSYLPETPATGLSGIPGLGDTNIPPVTTGSESQDILSNYAQRVSNMASGTVSRELTGTTSLSGTGSQTIIRYLNVPAGSSVDSDGYSALANFQHRFDARTSAGFRYVYNTFSYLSVNYGITTQMVGLQFERQLSRRASVTAFVGPQHVSSSDAAVIPSRTNFSGNASLTYVTRDLTTSLTFQQGASAGGGLIAGANTTSIHLTASRQFGRAWHASASGGYVQTSSLQTGAYGAKSVIFSTQANRSILRHLSAYVSYTLEHQLNSGTNIPTLALNGLFQSLSFGVTYAPEAIHLGH